VSRHEIDKSTRLQSQSRLHLTGVEKAADTTFTGVEKAINQSAALKSTKKTCHTVSGVDSEAEESNLKISALMTSKAAWSRCY